MTKAEFVDELEEKGKITNKLASDTIDLVFSSISDGLVAGDENGPKVFISKSAQRFCKVIPDV